MQVRWAIYAAISFLAMAQFACEKKDSASPPVVPQSANAQPTTKPSLPAPLSELVIAFQEKASKEIYLSPAWDLSKAQWRHESLAGTGMTHTERYLANAGKGTFTTAYEDRSFQQGRNIRCEIAVSKLTSADTLNGIEWSGRMNLAASAIRRYEPSSGWSSWKENPMLLPVVAYDAVKKSGMWYFSAPSMGAGDGGLAPSPEQVPAEVESGTPAYRAGRRLGQRIVTQLPSGGEIAVLANSFSQATVRETLQGMDEVFRGKQIQIVEQLEDGGDVQRARANTDKALAVNPGLKLICGLSTYHGRVIDAAINSASKKGKLLAAVAGD